MTMRRIRILDELDELSGQGHGVVTARDDMSAAGTRILDLLTMSEAAALLPGRLRSVAYVRRLAAAGELVRVDFGSVARITPESVAAYSQRQAS